MAKTRFPVDLKTKARTLCTELERNTLPISLDLFSDLSKKDLVWIQQQLNIKPKHSIDYWCGLVAKFSVYLIRRKEIRKWHSVETVLVSQTQLPQKIIGKVSLLFIYFRLAEIDNAYVSPDRIARKKKAGLYLQGIKKKAKYLLNNIDETEQSITQFLTDLSSYTQKPLGSLLNSLAPLQEANQQRVQMVKHLATTVIDLDQKTEPGLIQKIDELFYPNAKNRAYEYTNEEKVALLTVEAVLAAENFSGNKSAKLISELWDAMGPIREEWILGDRHQAIRRSLRHWKKKRR